MIKKVIEYTDYNGNERKETFLFNFTKAELLEMELSTEGGLSEKLQRIVDSKDSKEIVKFFKELILSSYGVKSDDGVRFVKSKEISDAFSQTEAYSILFMELATNSEEAARFVNGIIPQEKKPTPIQG